MEGGRERKEIAEEGRRGGVYRLEVRGVEGEVREWYVFRNKRGVLRDGEGKGGRERVRREMRDDKERRKRYGRSW